MTPCPVCGGTGVSLPPHTVPCPGCLGTGSAGYEARRRGNRIRHHDRKRRARGYRA